MNEIVRCAYLFRSDFTFSEIILPSALPASCLVAAPITLPMSCGPIAVENWQEQIPFEAVPGDDLPVVDLFDLENEDALRKVEQIPAWKRRFLKK